MYSSGPAPAVKVRTMSENQGHWDKVYATKAETEVSWYQPVPEVSLRLIAAAAPDKDAVILDVGAGASHLPDALITAGYRDLILLDISRAALDKTKARLAGSPARLRYLVEDMRDWQPDVTVDVWHDRAALHFLTAPEDRKAYRRALLRAVASGGQVILGTFALDGPERCSGLPVQRYDAAALQAFLGDDFALEEAFTSDHQTPAGGYQRFQFARFRRLR